jgi:hypothetical protein
MKKLSLAILFITVTQALSAQFYYNDLVQHQQHLERHKLYKAQKVTRIEARSSGEQDAPGVEPLIVEQSYNPSYSQLKSRASNVTGKSATTNYYNPQGLLYKTVDSSDASVTTYDYQYQEGSHLSRITSTSVPIGQKTKTIETHQWIYDSTGKPVKMIRIRDQYDSSEIALHYDPQGRVADEQIFRRAVAGEKTFYYYDDGGRLTDIVRYQDKLGKLMPDFTFDHDGEGRLLQMMVVQNGGMNYQTWRYAYNAQGLLRSESCYNREKKLIGKVEYTYELKR